MRRPITIVLLPADADELHERLGCSDDAELADAIRLQLEAKLFDYRHAPSTGRSSPAVLDRSFIPSHPARRTP